MSRVIFTFSLHPFAISDIDSCPHRSARLMAALRVTGVFDEPIEGAPIGWAAVSRMPAVWHIPISSFTRRRPFELRKLSVK
jgi:hypothetical protein